MHRFGPFEVDFSKAELRKNGVSIRLQEQPLRILQELLKRPGEVLTREELRHALWPSDTFVDFERSLNAAVAKLRAALNDSSEQPLYVETVARKGYRFIAPVSQNGPQSTGAAPGGSAPALRAASPSPQNLKRWLAIAFGGLCLALLAWTLRPTAPPAVGSVHFTVNLPEGTELAGPNFAPQMAISPDGRTLALAVSTAGQTGLFNALAGGGRRERTAPFLWLRPLASESGQRLEGTEGASRPFWSPNGREIGFFAPGKLKKIAASGGPVQILCDAKEPFGASWGPDGTIIFSAGGPLLRVSAVGGVPTQLTQLDAARGDFRHNFPQFLPGGRRFLLFITTLDPAKVGVFLGSLDGGQPQRVFANRNVAVFAPPDHLLFLRNGVLLTQRWDGQHVQERQAPIALATGVRAFTIGQSAFSVSQNGVLVYRQAGSGLVTQLACYGRDGKRLRTIGPPGAYEQVALSPDEKIAALSSSKISIIRLDSEVISQHDFGPVTNSDPVWSPDSRRLAFRTFEVGGLRSDIWQWTLGQPDSSALQLLADGKNNSIDDWSPDGRFLLIRRDSKLALRLPLLPDATPMSVGDSEFAKDQLQLSPDGARVAYNTVMSGRPEIYVAAFPGFSGRTQISPAGGVQPLWRRDGQELFYIAADGTLMSVKGTSAPMTLFKPPSFTFTDSTSQYAVSADGQRFYVLETVSAPSDTLHVVTQWNAGLPR